MAGETSGKLVISGRDNNGDSREINIEVLDKTLFIADVGIISQRHNRYLSGITSTYPGDDTFSVIWTQAENVRRYRILVVGGADGDYVKVTEDAPNFTVEGNWLADPGSNRDIDVEHFRVYTSTPDAAGSFIPLWSEWQELSKDPDDDSLSRLGFLASAAGPFTIFVEAE